MRFLLSNRVTTTVAATIFLVEFLVGTALTNVQVSWEGPIDLRVLIQGREHLLRGAQKTEAVTSVSRQAHLIRFAFVPLTIKAGSYSQVMRPLRPGSST